MPTATDLAVRRQFGLIWGAAVLTIAALAPWARSVARALPACPFRSLTGIPCPTCGATHALLALLALHPFRALAFNPLIIVATLIFVAGGILSGLLALAKRPLPVPGDQMGKALRVVIVAAVLLNWAYVIWTGA